MHDYSIVGEQDPTTGQWWVYTIGLLEEFDHPELVTVGYPVEEAAELLDEFAALVTARLRFEANSTITVNTSEVGIVSVQERYLEDGMMRVWHHYYEGPATLTLRAVQFVLPDEKFCFRHQKSQMVLGPLPSLCRGEIRAARKRRVRRKLGGRRKRQSD
jgi:hypothetical protein